MSFNDKTFDECHVTDEHNGQMRDYGSCSRCGHGMRRTVPSFAQGIPGARVAFRATLTATSNPYLAPRLPVEGLVQIWERSIYGELQFVTFLPDPEPGKNTSWVEVADAEFTAKTRA